MRARRNVTVRGSKGRGQTSSAAPSTAPPAVATMRETARSKARRIPSGSTPRSNR